MFSTYLYLFFVGVKCMVTNCPITHEIKFTLICLPYYVATQTQTQPIRCLCFQVLVDIFYCFEASWLSTIWSQVGMSEVWETWWKDWLSLTWLSTWSSIWCVYKRLICLTPRPLLSPLMCSEPNFTLSSLSTPVGLAYWFVRMFLSHALHHSLTQMIAILFYCVI